MLLILQNKLDDLKIEFENVKLNKNMFIVILKREVVLKRPTY